MLEYIIYNNDNNNCIKILKKNRQYFKLNVTPLAKDTHKLYICLQNFFSFLYFCFTLTSSNQHLF